MLSGFCNGPTEIHVVSQRVGSKADPQTYKYGGSDGLKFVEVTFPQLKPDAMPRWQTLLPSSVPARVTKPVTWVGTVLDTP